MPTIVEPLSVAGLDYLRSFNLKCVAVSKTGRVFTCNNPAGAVAAWWCKRDDAFAIANASWANGDVPGAAHRLGLTVTPHSVVAKRTADRTAKIDEALKQALDEGVLKMFNAEFRKRRLAAKRAGRRFMSYHAAHERLRRVVTEMVAKGGLVTQSLIAGVFDEARPSP
jgi:hypothetical protein